VVGRDGKEVVMSYESFRDPVVEDVEAERRALDAARESYVPRWFRWSLTAVFGGILLIASLPLLLLGLVIAWPFVLLMLPALVATIGSDGRVRAVAADYRHDHPRHRAAWMQPHTAAS
jgi:hypothetical protein